MQYDYKITFSQNQPFDINYINRLCNQHPNNKYLIEVENTKNISSHMLRQLPHNVIIRIAGGYDEQKVKNGYFKGNGYYDSVIYTRNETIKIVEEIEKIEAGINKSWSDIQKVVYIYDRLKREIMYAPKYKQLSSKDVRSLRGLITKQTVCAGYAIIFKELMDRQGISCEYVEGFANFYYSGHSWNIITINGKKYPVDLTWDNTRFRGGNFDTFVFLGQDIEAFSNKHHPLRSEPTQNYRCTLSQIDPWSIKNIYSQINRSVDYKTTTYYYTRTDGSRFMIAQVGSIPGVNCTYYRYYYVEIENDGKKGTPRIFYGTENITDFVDKKNFHKCVDRDYEKAIGDILFSKGNISDSITNNTNYIGGLGRNVRENYEVIKPEEHKKYFSYPTKTFRRSDGSTFIAQKVPSLIKVNRFNIMKYKVNRINIMKYIIFEIIKENGDEHLKENIVFTEKDFFLDNRQSMVDDFLSRQRLDRKLRDAGSYIGYYDNSGTRIYNPVLLKHFETSKITDIDPPAPRKPPLKLPSFEELEYLASTYEIFYLGNEIRVRDISTRIVQKDQTIAIKAIFANIWLSSAGIKRTPGETRFGEAFAFSSSSRELYDLICKKLLESCKNNSVIDTVELYKFIYEHSDLYNNGVEIIVNLFKTLTQIEAINKIFLEAAGINGDYITKIPTILFSGDYAHNLAYPSDRRSVRKV